MNTQNLPQYAKVQLPPGAPPPVVHCPICGHTVSDPDGADPCDHLVFMWYGGDFGYMSDNFSARIETADTDTFALDALKPLLETLGYGNNLLAIEITYGGMSDGATWTTDVYGFDYAALDVGAGTLDGFIGKFVDGKKLSELESTSYGAGEMDDDYDVHEIELSDFEFEGATDAAGWNAYTLRLAIDDDGRIMSIQRAGILRMAGGQGAEEDIEAFSHLTLENQALTILRTVAPNDT